MIRPTLLALVLALYSQTLIPEPGTALLVGMGLAGLSRRPRSARPR